MQLHKRLEQAWLAKGRFRTTHRTLTFTDQGLELGKGTLLVKYIQDDWDRRSLEIDGQEERILALLSVAWDHPMPDHVLDHFHNASRALAKGETTLAYIHLAHTGLQPLDHDSDSFRLLFMADGFLDAGISGNELRKAWGLGRSSFRKDGHDVSCEPRDRCGEWTTGGAASKDPKDASQTQAKTGPQVGDTIRGNASFYGNSDPSQGPTDHFAGQQTATGQIMDPTRMTAAVFPGSVPMGSTVRVALAGDPSRYVDVVVNDKGLYDVDENGHRVPIPGNRVIDLSPVAFRHLVGSLKPGPVSVVVTITKLPESKKK